MKVPKSMQEKYDTIASIIIRFCEKNLNEEYASVSLLLLAKLCRKRPSPLIKGNPNTWACGIVYAIGSTNFLFDKSQPLHMRAKELAERFGISQSTAGNKAGEIYKLLNIAPLDPEWTLPSMLGDNPFVWMFETESGFIVDVRHAAREIQEKLFNAGMIPFIPADRKPAELPREEKKVESHKADSPKKKREQIPIEGQLTLIDDDDA